MLASCSLEGAYSNEIFVVDRSDVVVIEADNGLSASGSSDKLNLKSMRRIQLNDSAQVAAAKAKVWKIAIKDNSIEKLQGHDFILGRQLQIAGLFHHSGRSRRSRRGRGDLRVLAA